VPYSRIVIALPVTRDVLPYLVKLVLPIFIVILITSLIYLLPARLEDARAGIGITAMLTIVALQWTTDASLPSVEYLTMLDLVYLVSMVYILAAMVYTVVASRRNRKEMAEALSAKLDRRVGVISLVVYLAILGLTLTYYLSQHYNILDQYI
jgi:predicted Na+-dependent transporter